MLIIYDHQLAAANKTGSTAKNTYQKVFTDLKKKKKQAMKIS